MASDEEILALFFDRSEQAIQEMDHKYGALCRQLSYRILNDRRDAEECVNDAYLGVWKAVPPERPSPLRAYLCKIVRNLSLKRREKESAAKRNGSYDLSMEELEACLPAPDYVQAELEVKELARMIEDFLDSLTQENRVIFMQRYWFSASYREISKQVGLSEKNVSVRLSRIRSQLKQHLTEREAL